MRILLPTIKQGYTSLLADSIEDFGIDVSFFEFESNEFSLRLIAKAIEEDHLRVDIVHLHWAHYHCYAGNSVKNFFRRRVRSIQLSIDNLIQIKKLKSLGCKIAWTVHNSLSHDAKFPLSEYIFRWGLSQLCDDIIVMSDFSRIEFQEKYKRRNKVHVIPHGNFVGALPNRIDCHASREKLGISCSSKVLLNFGLMKAYKGITDLLEVFDDIEDQDAILILAGHCPDPVLKNSIVNSTKRNKRVISYLRFIEENEIQLYMNACDWVVSPFRKVLNSGSVMLSLSFGKPTIVPNIGSLPELISNGQNGLVFNGKQNLLPTLKYALNLSEKDKKRFSLNAFESAKKYSWSNIGKHHVEVYRDSAEKSVH